MNKSIKKVVSIALSTTTVVWLTGASIFVPVAFAQSSADEIASLQALIVQLTAQLAALTQSGSAAPVTGSTACNFTRNLTVGVKGDDVKCLQQYLNGAGFQLASSGAGSPGSETTFFGPITRAAVIKWQDANVAGVLTPVGLSKGTGYWGSSSRSFFSSLGITSPGTPGTPTQTPVIPSAGLTLGIGAGNPAASNVPKGAAEVPYLQLVVSGNGTLGSLTFKRVGLGATGDFASSGVKLYEGGNRLTTGKTVNSTTHEVIFPNLKLVVNGSRTIMLTADMSGTATGGDLNGFNLIKVNGTVLDIPLKSNQMVVAGATVGTITITKQGSVSAPTVGDVQAKVTEFALEAGTAEDIVLRRIALTHGGSVNASHLTNFTLKQAGVVLGTVATHIGSDLFVMELDGDGYTLLKGAKRTFEVYADISPLAKLDETVDLYVDVINDVFATGDIYGYGVTVTNTFTSSDNHTALKLLGAEVTITFHGPATRNIAAKAQDVVLFDFSISTKNNIEIRKLVFASATTALDSGDGYDDFKVIDAVTGAAVTSSDTLDVANETITFTDIFNISAGTTRRFHVTADMDTDNDASDAIKITLNQIGANDIKNLDNNQFVAQATIVPNAATAGNTQTIQTVSLDVSLSGAPSSHNIVAGSVNEELVGFTLTARNGDVKVTALTLSADTASGTDATLRNDFRTIGLYFDGQLRGSKKSLAADGTVSDAAFTNLDYTINEGQSVTILVKADSIATNADADDTAFFYINDLSTELTAVDTDGNTLTLSGSVNGTDANAGTVVLTLTTPTLRVDAVTDTETQADLVIADGERLLAKFDFFAANAASTVTKLKVGLNTSASAATQNTLVQEVKEIRLYSGNTLLVSGVPEGGTVTHAGSVRFENTNGIFTVGTNETKQIEVRALLAAVTGVAGGADTGSSIVAYISNGQFEATAGNTTLTALTGSAAVGSIKRLYKSKPTVTISSPSSSVLTTGEIEVMKFTVAADVKGDIDWKKIEFTTAMSGATLTVDTITLRFGGTDLTLGTNTIAVSGDGDGGGSVEGVIELTTADRIAAGQSKTYSLLLNVATIIGGTSSASLSTKLRRDESAYITAGAYEAGEAAGQSFMWTDRGIAPHSLTSADWHNGFNVKTLPSGSKAQVK